VPRVLGSPLGHLSRRLNRPQIAATRLLFRARPCRRSAALTTTQQQRCHASRRVVRLALPRSPGASIIADAPDRHPRIHPSHASLVLVRRRDGLPDQALVRYVPPRGAQRDGEGGARRRGRSATEARWSSCYRVGRSGARPSRGSAVTTGCASWGPTCYSRNRRATDPWCGGAGVQTSRLPDQHPNLLD